MWRSTLSSMFLPFVTSQHVWISLLRILFERDFHLLLFVETELGFDSQMRQILFILMRLWKCVCCCLCICVCVFRVVYVMYRRPAAPEAWAAPGHWSWWRCWWPRKCSSPHQMAPLWRCRGFPSSGTRTVWCPGWRRTDTRWRSRWRWALRTEAEKRL